MVAFAVRRPLFNRAAAMMVADAVDMLPADIGGHPRCLIRCIASNMEVYIEGAKEELEQLDNYNALGLVIDLFSKVSL
jgi:hypothetical protein